MPTRGKASGSQIHPKVATLWPLTRGRVDSLAGKPGALFVYSHKMLQMGKGNGEQRIQKQLAGGAYAPRAALLQEDIW